MEDAERREVERARPFLPGAPELAQEGSFLRGESVRALDPPVGLGVVGSRREVLREEAGALLGVPLEATARGEVGLKERDESVEVEDVGSRVGDERRREGAAAPVGTLARLVERDAEARGEERGEADLLLSEELRGEHRVEDLARAEAVTAREETNVVVGAVKQETALGELREEGREVEAGERVDEPRATPSLASCRRQTFSK